MEYNKEQKNSLLKFIMKNPNYFNPRNTDDFADINDAMLWSKYIGESLDRNRLGKYTKEHDYFMPNRNVTDLVKIAGNNPKGFSGIGNTERIAKITKELLKK